MGPEPKTRPARRRRKSSLPDWQLVVSPARVAVHDERAKLLRRLLGTVVAIAIVGLVTAPLITPSPLVTASCYGAIGTGAALGLVALRLGQPTLAARLVSVIGVAVVLSTVAVWGGVRSPAVLALPATIFVMGLLWSGIAAAFATVFVIAVLLVVAWRFPGGLLPGVALLSPLGMWASFATSLAATAALVFVALRSMRDVSATARRNEHRFTAIVRQSPDGLVVVDPRHRIVSANPAALAIFGATDDAALRGVPFENVLPHEARVPMTQAVDRAWNGEPHVDVELALGPLDTGFWVVVRAHRVEDPEGQSVVLVLLRDVTEARRATERERALEARLSHGQKLELVGQLAGGIAHDFNNYLTAMLSSAETLKTEVREPEHRALAAELVEAAEQASKLTTQLLGFSRRQIVRPRVLGVDRAVERSVRMLRRVVEESVALEWEPSAPNGFVRIDEGQLHTAVMNLVVNARDVLSSGGTIRIRSRLESIDADEAAAREVRPGQYVVVEVSDDGPGIDASIRDRLFEPFFTTKPKGQGTGLGLASVFGIARQNQGFARLAPAGERGATFEVGFPLAGNPTPAVAVARTSITGVLAKKRVVLVEDEETVRRSTARILRREGMDVTPFGTAEEALDALATTSAGGFDLLLTDLVLPGIDGVVLATKLRARLGPIAVLAVSGYPPDSLRQADLESLRAVLLGKPFSREELLAAVQQALGTPRDGFSPSELRRGSVNPPEATPV